MLFQALAGCGLQKGGFVGALAKYSKRKIFSMVEEPQELRGGYVQAFEEPGVGVDSSMIAGSLGLWAMTA